MTIGPQPHHARIAQRIAPAGQLIEGRNLTRSDIELREAGAERCDPHAVVGCIRKCGHPYAAEPRGAMATQHLIDLGHTRIGFIGEPPNNSFGFVASVRREEGYRRVLRQAGIKPSNELVRYGAHLRSAAKQMTLDLLGLSDPPSAIVATSDVQAVGVIEAASSLGLRIPDDLSVVGYDDIELATLMSLTTVRQPLERSGSRAADLVLEAMNANSQAQLDEELEIELVVRSTTGPRR